MARRRFIVAYDIRDPKRLRYVHKTAKQFGYSLQYSVFVCDLSEQELIRFRWAMGDVIHDDIDEVVIIDIGDARNESRIDFLGRHPRLPKQGPTIV